MSPADAGVEALAALLPLGRAVGLTLPDAAEIRTRAELRRHCDLPALRAEEAVLEQLWQPVAEGLADLPAAEAALHAGWLTPAGRLAGDVLAEQRQRLYRDLDELHALTAAISAAAAGLTDLFTAYDRALRRLADPMPSDAPVADEIAARAELFEAATGTAEAAVTDTLDLLTRGGGELALAGAR